MDLLITSILDNNNKSNIIHILIKAMMYVSCFKPISANRVKQEREEKKKKEKNTQQNSGR